MKQFDVDIDLPPSVERKKYGVRGMVYKNENCTPHPSCFYLQDVPVDPISECAAFHYEEDFCKELIKVDLLVNRSYENIRSKEDLLRFAETEPDWDMLLDEDVVTKLPHIGKYYWLVSQIKPNCIEDLADTIALIRPGKSHLIENYLKNKKSVKRFLYKRSANEQAYFKKSHAISYALMIVVVMNSRKFSSGIIW